MRKIWIRPVFLLTIICILILVIYDIFSVLQIRDGSDVEKITLEEFCEEINLSLYQTAFASKQTETQNELQLAEGYIISEPGCKIPNVDPFSETAMNCYREDPYQRCSSRDLLSYTTKSENGTTILHINQTLIPSFTSEEIECCYSAITRNDRSSAPDSYNSVSGCRSFEGSVTITNDDVIKVQCNQKNRKSKKIYENTHYFLRVKSDLIDATKTANKTQAPSVLFIGIDSVSRLHLIRSMPSTYKYLAKNNWLNLLGYNKIGDNTFPNLVAILSGYSEDVTLKKFNPDISGNLDKVPFVWKDYKKFGYVTTFGEDEKWMATFNINHKKGFRQLPVDYYFRSYLLASEQMVSENKDSGSYCSGPEVTAERIMNLIREFTSTFQNHLSFGFFWINSFSHNHLDMSHRLDKQVRQLFEDLNNTNVYDNTIVIFLSDHGRRNGCIRTTYTGWLEERLPFIYVSFPEWFQIQHPKEYQNFVTNTKKLTTPYDLHLTIQDLLKISGFDHDIRPSDGCPGCQSLFEVVDGERTCKDASIEQHWCTCNNLKTIESDKELTSKGICFMLHEINSILSRGNAQEVCAKYELSKIINSYTVENDTVPFSLITIETKPKAVFDATIGFIGKNKTPTLSGSISRLDVYGPTSQCVDDTLLKKYCYCVN